MNQGADSELIRILRDLLRFDTTNPPGNELACAQYLAGLFRKEGLDPVVLESKPGRGNVVVRLKGDGTAKPLLLSAHLDVVAATEPEWQHPPFEAEVHDGYVWGRGAVDMKHMAAMSALVVLELARKGVKLKRDVVFAGVADEEAGWRCGAGWLVDNHRDLIAAEFCLTELGGMSVPMARGTIVPVQIAERGFEWFRMKVRGAAGHGSLPKGDSAIDKLCRAVEKLEKPLGYHLTPTARDFIKAVASVQPQPNATALLGLLSEHTAWATLHLVPEGRRAAFRSMLFNTAAVTVLEAGSKVNVIPGEASALVDGRYLPGVTREQFLEEVKRVIGEEFELEHVEGGPPTMMPFESGVLDAIRRVLGKALPEAHVVPYLIPGMTDAKHFARAGITTYGFAPVALKLDEPFAELYHAPNERVSIDGLHMGCEWLRDVVLDLAGS